MEFFPNVLFVLFSQEIIPNLINPTFSSGPEASVTKTTITLKLPLKNQVCYVVAGLLSQYFNATSMSVP
jgi:hypothetical protein